MILYTLHCDGVGCLRTIDSAFGDGIQMPEGWSEFRGNVTISNGPFVSPTTKTILKHYCWDCRDRMREHGVAPSETVVMGPDRLGSGEASDAEIKCRCGYIFRSGETGACPRCGSRRKLKAARTGVT